MGRPEEFGASDRLRLVTMPDAGHDLRPARRSGLTIDAAAARVAEAVVEFVGVGEE